MRKFIGVYIFIYVSVCFDQILDGIFNDNLNGVKINNFFIFF